MFKKFTKDENEKRSLIDIKERLGYLKELLVDHKKNENINNENQKKQEMMKKKISYREENILSS